MVDAHAEIAENLARLEEQIGVAAHRAGRDPAEITLIGISKTQPAEAVVAAVRAGVRHIGENRVQEAALKLPSVRAALGDDADVAFHLVGHLQRNKAGPAVALFDRIDSVDSLALAQALTRRAPGDLSVLLEVYVGDDPQRPGLRPAKLVDTVGRLLEVPRLRVDGLMTVAPLGADARTAFAAVRALKHRLSEAFPVVHFDVLSMGMSEDYAAAIEEGSTEVRIGTALFGPRRTEH